jgi:hypothetical protein
MAFLLLGPFLIYGVLYISPLYLLILPVQSLKTGLAPTVVKQYNNKNIKMTSYKLNNVIISDMLKMIS